MFNPAAALSQVVAGNLGAAQFFTVVLAEMVGSILGGLTVWILYMPQLYKAGAQVFTFADLKEGYTSNSRLVGVRGKPVRAQAAPRRTACCAALPCAVPCCAAGRPPAAVQAERRRCARRRQQPPAQHAAAAAPCADGMLCCVPCHTRAPCPRLAAQQADHHGAQG
jgi:hypothetical protein